MAVQLGFQVGEEVLGDRVVPAHTDLAHGLGDVVLAAPLLEFVGGVLGAPVGMEDHGVPFRPWFRAIRRAEVHRLARMFSAMDHPMTMPETGR